MNAQLADFRAQVDDFFEHHPQSPLDWQQRQEFSGIQYYDENEDLIVEAEVKLLSADEPLIQMSTNTGEIRTYRRWGQFSFSVDDQQATLTIYSDPHGHELFMPFKDTSNGAETYGAGRYMDNHRSSLQLLPNSYIEVDFNYAYNPYCAYNMGYSCPLPPSENWLAVPIRAGEKKFSA